MNSWLKDNLVCPRDHTGLNWGQGRIICANGHSYPYMDGIPVMLVEEAEPTHAECSRTLKNANQRPDTLNLDPAEPELGGAGIDPFVQKNIGATCGIMYLPLIGKLSHYPIPELRLPRGHGEIFLEIGCNWGRWCISAERCGYHPVGIDPSLEAIQAARRVARQLNASAEYLVADGRYLPFANRCVDRVFSYSVLQHFGKKNARIALQDIARILKPSGFSLVQMPNKFGLVNLILQIMRFGKQAKRFDVRYWSLGELQKTFTECIGPTTVFVDGFFSLNSQRSDLELLPIGYKSVVILSDVLRKLTERLPWMRLFADSLYLRSMGAALDRRM